MCVALTAILPVAAVEAALGAALGGMKSGPGPVWAVLPITFLPWLAGAAAFCAQFRGVRWGWVLPALGVGLVGLGILPLSCFG